MILILLGDGVVASRSAQQIESPKLGLDRHNRRLVLCGYGGCLCGHRGGQSAGRSNPAVTIAKLVHGGRR